MSDLEVGRFALRTFDLTTGRPESICGSLGTGHWKGGVCEARCLAGSYNKVYSIYSDFWDTVEPVRDCAHPAPDPECECGIYGSLSLKHLQRQYEAARSLVAVIAAEGQTLIGSRGLRTERARVVAFWYSRPLSFEWYTWGATWYIRNAWGTPSAIPPNAVDQYFPGATRYDDPGAMARYYGLDVDSDKLEDYPHASPDFWKKGERHG